jgi:hypothetical protein
METICPKGAGGLFTFGVKGGYEACVKLVDSVEIFSHVANLGDTRSLIIHSASTTHRQLTPEQQKAAGAAPNVVRLSIGIEDAGRPDRRPRSGAGQGHRLTRPDAHATPRHPSRGLATAGTGLRHPGGSRDPGATVHQRTPAPQLCAF